MTETPSQYRRCREKLWQKDPHCHWCKCLTVLLPPDGNRRIWPDNTATIDHLRSRYDSTRSHPNPNREKRRVLACRKCNGLRNDEEQKQLPRDVLQKLAGNYSGVVNLSAQQEWKFTEQEEPPVNKPIWGAEEDHGGVFLCVWDGENRTDNGHPYITKIDNEYDDDMYIVAWRPATIPGYPKTLIRKFRELTPQENR